MKESNLYHNISLNDIYRHMSTKTEGLSSQEIKKRLSTYGYNELPIKKKTSLFRGVPRHRPAHRFPSKAHAKHFPVWYRLTNGYSYR